MVPARAVGDAVIGRATTKGRDMAQPKHQEVRERILSEVTADLSPQDMLPTERQLAERFGVSRMTVRQAMNGLRNDGVLHSVRGLGTFLAVPRLSKSPALTSFSEDLKSRGFVPSTKVLAVEEARLSTDIAIELGVAPGTRAYRVERLRLADGNPMCHEEVFLPAHRFPGLATHALDQSLYAVLRDQYGVVMRRAQQQIKAINLDSALAELLAVEPGAAALLVKRITQDEEGRIVERGQSICRGDLYDFSLVVTRQA
jgi:GntR family transcriptional regulator